MKEPGCESAPAFLLVDWTRAKQKSRSITASAFVFGGRSTRAYSPNAGNRPSGPYSIEPLPVSPRRIE
ncbi:hypothetical protein ACLFKT_45250, partial [Paraburkholderia sp. BR14261]